MSINATKKQSVPTQREVSIVHVIQASAEAGLSVSTRMSVSMVLMTVIPMKLVKIQKEGTPVLRSKSSTVFFTLYLLED